MRGKAEAILMSRLSRCGKERVNATGATYGALKRSYSCVCIGDFPQTQTGSVALTDVSHALSGAADRRRELLYSTIAAAAHLMELLESRGVY